MNNKTMTWIGIGCVALCILAVAAFVVLGAGGIAWLSGLTPKDIEVTVDHPAQIERGEEIAIEIRITNTGPAAQQLVSIDFSMNYLDGIVIDRSEPDHTHTTQFDALGGGESFLSYYFDRSIAPGETLLVAFTGTAIHEGDFAGDISICVNSEYQCMNAAARTLIR
jgi:hypothetical protein